jgi:hypothetical protein
MPTEFVSSGEEVLFCETPRRAPPFRSVLYSIPAYDIPLRPSESLRVADKRLAMRFLAENWFFILVLIGFFFMMSGHGGCGMHGHGHGHGGHEQKPNTKTDTHEEEEEVHAHHH